MSEEWRKPKEKPANVMRAIVDKRETFQEDVAKKGEGRPNFY
jgi:hypothetical protein